MITPLGYIRPSFDEILLEVQDNIRVKFDDGGENNISFEPEEFFGGLALIIAEIRNQQEEIAERFYFDSFLTLATGISLDRRAAPTARRGKTSAITIIDFTGTDTTLIPEGFLIETETSIQYATVQDVTIVAGVASVGIKSVIPGVGGNAPVGAIKFIPVPLTNLDTATNPAPAIDGREIETDDVYRQRTIDIRSADHTSTLAAIVNQVRKVEGVLTVIGFENIENIFVDGRPANSIEIVVRGGADQDIADAIFLTKPAGIETFGSESETVLASNGQIFIIEFSRIVQVSINVEHTITTDALYNAITAKPLIRQRTLDYIGGVNPDTIESEGVRASEDIYSFKAAGVIFELGSPDAIPGITSVITKISKNPAPATLDIIIIADTEEAFTDFANILITEI